MTRRPIDPWGVAAALFFLGGLIATLWWGFGLNRDLPCNGRAACSSGAAR